MLSEALILWIVFLAAIQLTLTSLLAHALALL